MTRLINILYNRLTYGNLLTAIATFIFAIALRQLFLFVFDILPIKGELQTVDISYLAIIILFRLICNAFLELLLNDKFDTSLIKELGYKQSTALNMENTANTNSSGKGSSKGSGGGTSSKEALTEEQYAKVKQMINNKAERDPGFKQKLEETNKFVEEMSAHSDKMNAVLNEQTGKILKLHSIASRNDVRFIQENGGLELSVPSSMSNDVAEKLSKEVGALDRALQNKFSEYDNLSRKDIRLYNSSGTTIYSGILSNNKLMYKELFESENSNITKKKKIGTLKLVH